MNTRFLSVLLLALSAAGASAGPAWRIQTTGTKASLRGLSVVDAKTAWASGSGGTVLRTVDGGASWLSAAVPGQDRTDFRDIQAFDAAAAVVLGIGRPARIFRTSDGGARWTEVFMSDAPGIFLDGLDFAGKETGWAVGDPIDGRFVLLRTIDGGRTWSELPPERRPAALEGEGCFAASGTSLVARSRDEVLFCTGGPDARLLRTTDGGATWTATSLPLLAGKASQGAFGLAFKAGGLGLALGGDYRDEPAAAGNAAVTGDGGAHWTAAASRPPSGFRECAAFVPGSDKAVAVGPSGSDFSEDGGRTWTPIPGPGGWHSLGVSPDGRRIWAVGKGGLAAILEF